MDKIEFFNSMAETWDNKFYTDDNIRYIQQLVSEFYLPKGVKVLDVGTGTGGIIPFVLDAIGDDGLIEAIDYAEEMIKRARQKFVNEKRVRFSVCDVSDTPFDDGYFDYVICFGVFPHVQDKHKALKEIYRILRPQGHIIIAHALSSEEIRYHHSNCHPVKNDFLPDEKEMNNMLIDAGFELIRLIDQPRKYIAEGVKI